MTAIASRSLASSGHRKRREEIGRFCVAGGANANAEATMMIRKRQDFMVRLLVQVAIERMCNTNKRK
jgi:hypothetical protein